MPPSRFERRPFLILNAVACVLFASWVFSPARAWWDALDARVFAALNGTLDASGPSPWNTLWAVVNVRSFDAVSFVGMGVLLLLSCRARDERRVIAGLAVFPALLFVLILARESLEAIADVAGWNRASPSLRGGSTVLLSKIYPEWSPKDRSLASFPGDHAGVLFIWLGYCLYLVRDRWTWLVAGFTTFSLLPRLVSGAHTLSDELVGGGVAALVALAVCLYTPLCAPAVRSVAAGVNRVLERLATHPLCPDWSDTARVAVRGGPGDADGASSA